MAIAKLSQSANAKHSKSEAGKTEKGGGGGEGMEHLGFIRVELGWDLGI